MSKKSGRLGKLPPQYRFFLNHYHEFRFTNCPLCEQQMKVRKHPFFIHVNPTQPVLLNMSGRYCPACDLLILPQDKVEELLIAALSRHDPGLIGNEYLVLGTVERKAWRESQKNAYDWQTTLDNLHEFKEVVLIEPAYWGWGPAEE